LCADSWPKRKDGHLSTSGTTATVVILRKNKIYFAHVGDSAAVIAQKKNNKYVAQELTVDHKPESYKEKSRLVHEFNCCSHSSIHFYTMILIDKPINTFRFILKS